MKGKGLGDCARQLLKEVSTVRSMDVVLKARPDTETEPDPNCDCASWPGRTNRWQNYSSTSGSELPHAPKIVQNVVPQNQP